MKQSIIYTLIIYAFVAFAANSPNLLNNGDFEDGLNNWRNAGWIKNLLAPILDNNVMHGPGMGAVRFDGELGKRAFCLYIFKPDINDKKFLLSAWIKTENFENNWWASVIAECVVKQINGKNKYKYFSISTEWDKKNTPWTLYKKIFELPPQTQSIRIILSTKASEKGMLKGNTGKVWFDDISLIKLNNNKKE